MLQSHSQSSLGMCPHHASSLERVSGSVKSSRHCSRVMGPDWVALDVGSFLQSCRREERGTCRGSEGEKKRSITYMQKKKSEEIHVVEKGRRGRQ